MGGDVIKHLAWILLIFSGVANAQSWNYFNPGPPGQLEVSNGTAYLQPATIANITNLWTGCAVSAPLLVGGICSPMVITPADHSIGITINSAGIGADTYPDLNIFRVSSAADVVASGANIQLAGGAGTATDFQNAGGQTELWQFNSGAWNEILRVNPQRQVLIQAPASGPALTVNAAGNNESVFAGGSVESLGGAALYTGISSVIGGETSVAGGFNNYLGLNWHFDGSGNWITGTDGGSNGAGMILSPHSVGGLTFYTIPSTGGINQSIPSTSLPAYQRFSIDQFGATAIQAPSQGIALNVNSNPTNFAMLINTNKNSTSGVADLVVARLATGTANTAAGGSNIELANNSSQFATILQNAAGQTELWQYNAGWNQLAYWDINRLPHLLGVPSTLTAQTGFMCWSNTSGQISYNAAGACTTSSIRYKQDVHPLSEGLDAVMKLRPVEFNYKPLYNPGKIGQQVGFIAEDVQKVDPRLTPLDEGGQPYSVEYQNITALLTRAIQDQQNEIRWLWAALGLIILWNLYLTVRPSDRPSN